MARINEYDPLIQQFVARFGLESRRSEVCSALQDLLRQLPCSTQAVSNDDNSTSKKRKRASDSSSGSESGCARTVQLYVLKKSLSVPAFFTPLPPGSLAFAALPQHIILTIFDYIEYVVEDIEDLALAQCRFRSQTTERQWHLQYHTMRICVSDKLMKQIMGSAPEYEGGQNIDWIRFLLRQARIVTVDGIDCNDAYFNYYLDDICNYLVDQPHLRTVRIDSLELFTVEELFRGSIGEGIPEELRRKVTSLALTQTLPGGADFQESQFSHLTSLQHLEYDFQFYLPCLSKLNSISGGMSKDVAIEILQKCPSLETLEVTQTYDDDDDALLSVDLNTWCVEHVPASHKNLCFSPNIWCVRQLPIFPTLRKLTFACASEFSFYGISELKYLEEMRLYLKSNTELTNERELEQLRSLSVLRLENANRLDYSLQSAIGSLNRRGQLYELTISCKKSRYDSPDAQVLFGTLGIGRHCALRTLCLLGDICIVEQTSHNLAVESLKACQYLTCAKVSSLPIYFSWEARNKELAL